MLRAVRNQARSVLLASRTRLPTANQLFRPPAFSQPFSSSRTSLFPGFRENRSVANNDTNLPSFRRSVPPSETLYVGNLPYSTDENELREKFSTFGELVDVRVGECSSFEKKNEKKN
jgi:RNA recognition motif-containing protein